MRVKRSELLDKLVSLTPGIARREIIEQSTCFVFDKGTIYTFNDEVCCRQEDRETRHITGAVPAKPLKDLLSKLPDEELGFEVVGGELLVTGKRRKAGLRIETDVALAISAVEEPGTWHDLPAVFEDALSIVTPCVTDDKSRFAFTCVHVTPKHVEACDNHQMIRYRIKKFPVQEEFLVRGDALKNIATLNAGVTQISVTKSWVHFKNPEGLVYSCRKYDDEYPDLTPHLKADGEDLPLPGGLIEAVTKAQIFVQEAESDKVKVEIKNGKIVVSGRGVQGWFRETMRTSYAGRPLTFLISAVMLTEIAKKHKTVQITDGKLTVRGENGKKRLPSFTYAACLSEEEEAEDTQDTEAVAAGAEE